MFHNLRNLVVIFIISTSFSALSLFSLYFSLFVMQDAALRSTDNNNWTRMNHGAIVGESFWFVFMYEVLSIRFK